MLVKENKKQKPAKKSLKVSEYEYDLFLFKIILQKSFQVSKKLFKNLKDLLAIPSLPHSQLITSIHNLVI